MIKKMSKQRTLKRLKIMIFFLYFSSLFFYLNKKREYQNQVIITLEEDSFATYRNGKIYICLLDDLEYYRTKLKENDVLVVDARAEEDIEMVILDSYQIHSKDDMYDILYALEQYEKLYPSSWNRSIESMLNEWVIHNLAYDMNYQIESSKDVDLDNIDEFLYDNPVLTKILKN